MRVTVQLSEQLTAGQKKIVRRASLGQLLRSAGATLGLGGSLTVRLVGDQEIAALNAQFRQVTGPTDVLAFPGGVVTYVGDIAISVDAAERQSLVPAAELRMLAVHGLLHCIGYDHAEPEEASRMTDKTRELLPEQEIPALVPA